MTAILFAISLSLSQTAEVRFGDGSIVRMGGLQESLEVKTSYGTLTIPFKEIRRIDFGVHLPEGAEAKIESALKRLGSGIFREREEATKELIRFGHMAYPFLQRDCRSQDQEIATRSRRILDQIPMQGLRTKEEDVILTKEFTVVGRIVPVTLKAHSVHFGDQNLKVCDLRTMHVRAGKNEFEFTVESARFGDQWLDTEVFIDAASRFGIRAEGQVDLWPAGPGQYMASPRGWTTTGKGGDFMAGALVGRIGQNGKAFFIGDNFNCSPTEEGNLHLRIVPSPWNNASFGSYSVRVNLD